MSKINEVKEQLNNCLAREKETKQQYLENLQRKQQEYDDLEQEYDDLHHEAAVFSQRIINEREAIRDELERYKNLVKRGFLGGKKTKRKKRRKRKTRKQMNKIRMKDSKSCCAGPGCPEWKHCINVLGDESMGIRPKTANTLKIIEKCAKRYSTYKNKNYKKCLKRERKKLRKKRTRRKRGYRVKSRK